MSGLVLPFLDRPTQVSDMLKASGVLELDKSGLGVVKHGEGFVEILANCEDLREVSTDEGDSIC